MRTPEREARLLEGQEESQGETRKGNRGTARELRGKSVVKRPEEQGGPQGLSTTGLEPVSRCNRSPDRHNLREQALTVGKEGTVEGALSLEESTPADRSSLDTDQEVQSNGKEQMPRQFPEVSLQQQASTSQALLPHGHHNLREQQHRPETKCLNT